VFSGLSRRVLVTAALPYVYAPRHFGHLAGAYLPADIYARFRRLKGDTVLFVCGTDENAASVILEALKQGLTPKELCDKYYDVQKEVFEKLAISFDIYSRTSKPIHYETVREFYGNLYRKGYVYPREIIQLYCPNCRRPLPDRFVKGVCPYCGAEDQYGDVCEVCGKWYEAWELLNPRCSICGAKPIEQKAVHWFLKLSALTEDVLRYVEQKKYWRRATYNKTIDWLKREGLKDKDITRDYDWGPPAPFPNAEGQVIYNWAENLLGYISATKDWAMERNESDAWRSFWLDSNTELYCFIGKDNLFFHTILFPALLLAHGGYILPENVIVNEFVTLEGRKLSTSRGWVVWLHEMLENFHPDIIRFYAARIAPEFKDSDFKWSDFMSKVNDELIGNLANFLYRTLMLTYKLFNGEVPDPRMLTDEDRAYLERVDRLIVRVEKSLENFRFKEGLSTILSISALGNRLLNEREPWKEAIDEAARTLYIALQIIYKLSILLSLYLPYTAAKLRRILGLSEQVKWDELYDELKPGIRIGKPEIFFEKISKEDIEREEAKLKVRVTEG